MDWLATWAPEAGARRRWALAELLVAAGIPARPVDLPDAVGDRPLLVLGDADPGRACCRIPDAGTSIGAGGGGVMPDRGGAELDHGIVLDLAGLLPELAVGPDPVAVGDRFPLPAVAILEALLTDVPHRALTPADTDAHGRLRHAASLPARAGVGDVPLVDRLVDAVGRWLETRLGLQRMERWPGGARAAVVLSHDVDHPDRYGILRAVSRDPRRLRSAPRTLLAKAAREARARLRDPDPAAFWAFDALVASEGRRGFTSTYLFASTPFHGPWGADLDVAYDIRERRFRAVFERLQASGNEVGLHTGYNAHAAPGRIAAERRRLADVSGLEIRGNRHHYWQLGPSPDTTLREHDAAGFAWDASLAFNEHPGFRRSTTLPFHPWDPTADAPLRLLEIPTACMDGSLLYAGGTAEAAIETVDAQLAAIAASGGALTIDWHLQASVPTNPEYRTWADAYQGILDILVAREGLWVTGLDAMERWWTQRGERLRSIAAG